MIFRIIVSMFQIFAKTGNLTPGALSYPHHTASKSYTPVPSRTSVSYLPWKCGQHLGYSCCAHVCVHIHTHTHTHTNGLAHPLCEEVLGQSKSLPHSFCLTFTITLGGRSCWDSLAPFEKMRKIKPSKKQNLSVVSPRVISGRGKKGCKGSLVTPGPGCVPGRSELLKQASSPQEQ